MSASLKPCPFCGGTEHITLAEGSTFRWLVTTCGECEAQGPSIRKEHTGVGWNEADEKEAFEEWNRRSGPSREAMREALERCRPLIRLLTVRTVIEGGDKAIAASGLNPWCMNEGTARGDERIDASFIDSALALDGWKP